VTKSAKFDALVKPFFYRPGTHDEYIIERVVKDNVYGLSGDMKKQIVIDIGAHIGSFSCLAASKGAVVWAFEPQSENFEILAQNAKAYDGKISYRINPYKFS
jgi:predicted RNA methylase